MLIAQSDRQRGAALAVSLIFLLLMTLAAVTAVQGSASQERMAANIQFKNDSFQAAEAGLRQAEADLLDNLAHFAVPCSGAGCNVEQSIFDLSSHSRPSADWVKISPSVHTNDMTVWYRVINLGQASAPVQSPLAAPGTLYRVVVVAFRGSTRTVLESVYVRTEA
ncbi:MAG: PilX N-terminal domain-containing pilus assembly protein [Gammaproteobacteria bacterium]|nr:PilX N-terminal domain-containing pilus assembly protein [Gammaproteobacteria bacterium]